MKLRPQKFPGQDEISKIDLILTFLFMTLSDYQGLSGIIIMKLRPSQIMGQYFKRKPGMMETPVGCMMAAMMTGTTGMGRGPPFSSFCSFKNVQTAATALKTLNIYKGLVAL